MSCENFVPDCPCSTYKCRPRNPPLRTMQKALVDKWTELEKLGQLAHMYWCQERALRQQLACLQAKYCWLQRQESIDNEPCGQYGRTRYTESNQIQPYCPPDNPSVYQGVLKIRDRENAPNQVCICNNPETTTTYRGVVRVHDQDNGAQQICPPAPCRQNYALESEKLRTECQIKDLTHQISKITQCQVEIHGKLQKLHEELECLQSKIKSNWGQNAVDRCTPAKENQTRFF